MDQLIQDQRHTVRAVTLRPEDQLQPEVSNQPVRRRRLQELRAATCTVFTSARRSRWSATIPTTSCDRRAEVEEFPTTCSIVTLRRTRTTVTLTHAGAEEGAIEAAVEEARRARPRPPVRCRASESRRQSVQAFRQTRRRWIGNRETDSGFAARTKKVLRGCDEPLKTWNRRTASSTSSTVARGRSNF